MVDTVGTAPAHSHMATVAIGMDTVDGAAAAGVGARLSDSMAPITIAITTIIPTTIITIIADIIAAITTVKPQ